MSIRIGYLLPTREQIMEGRPGTAPLLALAGRAEALGFEAVAALRDRIIGRAGPAAA